MKPRLIKFKKKPRLYPKGGSKAKKKLVMTIKENMHLTISLQLCFVFLLFKSKCSWKDFEKGADIFFV